MNLPAALALLALSAPALLVGGSPAAAAAPAELPNPAAATVPRSLTRVCVLGYGRIGDEGLPLEEFVRQMNYLRESGLTPISLAELLAWKRGEQCLPQHCVLITFEEAGQELAQAALPLLQSCGFPCLIFVDAHNLRGESGYLGPEQLRRLADSGVALGSLTMNRPSREDWQYCGLAGTQSGERMVAAEMTSPAEAIREMVGSCLAFCYPNGYVDPLMLSHMAASGYRVAFSRAEGKLRAEDPAFTLHRYMVQDRAGFVRAVNFGAEAEQALVDSAIARQPATLPGGQAVGPASADEQTELPLIPMEGNAALARRGVGGEWVTPSFAAPLVPREQTRVAVLGYHNFSNRKRVSDMLMRTSEFCTQMQYIRDAGLSVISMQDFLDWKQGRRLLPERCVLITIDDGWKSVYTDAYPVLKAYGYPFTLFLYTRYINVQGDSLSLARIRDMEANGATIGSHSCNHFYPRSWKRLANDEEAYAAQVKQEIGESRSKLIKLFGKCSTYCYPGGYNTPPMLAELEASGYGAAFTVLEAKVGCEESDYLVHRYMILGTEPRIFRRAVNFDGTAGVQPVREGIEAAAARAREFFPQAFEGLEPAAAQTENPAP